MDYYIFSVIDSILHIINASSLIRTNSVIGTYILKIGTPLFGLARVYYNIFLNFDAKSILST